MHDENVYTNTQADTIDWAQIIEQVRLFKERQSVDGSLRDDPFARMLTDTPMLVHAYTNQFRVGDCG